VRNPPEFVNEFRLTAAVALAQPLRYTPAGLPALDVVLEHQSEVQQMGQNRKVSLVLKAQAFGSLAETLARQALGTAHEFHGFLSQARTGKGVVFQIQDFTPV
jgi:primosomal replication protein N